MLLLCWKTSNSSRSLTSLVRMAFLCNWSYWLWTAFFQSIVFDSAIVICLMSCRTGLSCWYDFRHKRNINEADMKWHQMNGKPSQCMVLLLPKYSQLKYESCHLCFDSKEAIRAALRLVSVIPHFDNHKYVCYCVRCYTKLHAKRGLFNAKFFYSRWEIETENLMHDFET